ncbi:MAG TPA: protein kinase [Gemmatimonadales bacterium]|nr:protein kinase [Gemmatimonadales bacterium]
MIDALADRYTILQELGHGGMATVYLADDRRHGRQVAIKVLRPELGALLGPDRFTREIRIAAALNHPHILPLYDSGEIVVSRESRVVDALPTTHDSRLTTLLYYVMPHVRGGSLRQRLTAERWLAVDEAIRLVRQAASALDHAHAHGLIHRDIKPENILLHEGEAMVADFGIALAAGTDPGERLTQTGLMVGTPEYMSPEQSAGERALDARSDVYSLGCVLYELLAGAPPHAGGTARSVIMRRFSQPPPRVRQVRPEVSAAVDEAIARALAVDPAERFPSAGAFADALAGRAVPARAPRQPSVAVLPFANLSADPENEFFADGITEDVIAQLSKIRALKVISRGSVMRFKQREQSLREIGVTLDVATLLEGSIRRAGGRVRIVAQLIDAGSDRHLWAETYDRELTDIFAIQSDVALQIASALRAELTPEERSRIREEPTDDAEAYQLHLLGRHCFLRWTQEGIDKGLEYLHQAVSLDPDYALAYTTLAQAYTDIALGVAGAMPPDEAFGRAKAAVARALELDPELAEAHAALGHLKYACDYDWTGAEAELKRAIELNPNSGNAYDFYGLMLAALERYDEALRMQRRANELDPLAHRMDIVTTLLRAERYDEALRAITRVLEVEPHFPLAHATLGWVHLLSGRPDEGIAELEKAVSLSPEHTLYLAQLGQAYARVGRTADAREVLRQLAELSRQRYVSPYHMAYVHTGLGEYERAMDWLERAYEERAGGVFGLKGSFLFAPLRSHPRFRALLGKMNLGE